MAGCAPTINETNFAAGREALVGSPALYKQNVANCSAWMRRNPALWDRTTLLTSQPKERVPEIACERLTRAFREGRYSYKLYLNAHQGVTDPELVKIIQGR